jgi:hypothetical protein
VKKMHFALFLLLGGRGAQEKEQGEVHLLHGISS